MGIKGLWSIFAPFCERKPLYELQGKTVAIDLSCWVCESQNVTEYTIQPRMYLRNLYFRTCYLLLMDVNVVFVLEGRAPELKYKTIAARNALQFKGQKPKTEKTKTGKDRSRFNHTLKQCEEMLKLMGLACVKGEGEAEALCAHLNEDGLIDGIISQDSDCFAYGARVVFRNFSISQQGNHAAKGGSIDIYDIAKVNQNLNIGRNKIIALALLCGSDYCDGVYGIGKDSALKLFNVVSEDKILERLRSWRDESIYQRLESKISDKNLCTSCGHLGKIQSHTKKGCAQCGTTQGCDSSRFKNERLDIKNELSMRSKALIDPQFPDESLINEFRTRSTNVSELNLKWQKPDLRNFIKFTVKYLMWEEIYSFEKFLPILTRWQLVHYNQIETPDGIVNPRIIKKRRNPKGVASYEIIWEDGDNQFMELIPPEQQSDCGDLEKLWSTIEPQNLVEKVYPDLVQVFEDSKKPKTKVRKKKAVKEIDDLMKNISISGPSVRKKPKKLHTLDSFIQKASTPKKIVQNSSFNMDQSNFGDENDLELSDIIDDIISKKVPSYVPESLDRLGLKLNQEDDSNCGFFTGEMTENDLFEKTFREYCISSDDSDEYCELK